MPKTKSQLNNEIATKWPDNTSGLIKAADLRFIGTGIVDSIPSYSSGGYIKIDAVASTGILASGLEMGMLVYHSGLQKLYFWTSTQFKEIAFV